VHVDEEAVKEQNKKLGKSTGLTLSEKLLRKASSPNYRRDRTTTASSKGMNKLFISKFHRTPKGKAPMNLSPMQLAELSQDNPQRIHRVQLNSLMSDLCLTKTHYSGQIAIQRPFIQVLKPRLKSAYKLQKYNQTSNFPPQKPKGLDKIGSGFNCVGRKKDLLEKDYFNHRRASNLQFIPRYRLDASQEVSRGAFAMSQDAFAISRNALAISREVKSRDSRLSETSDSCDRTKLGEDLSYWGDGFHRRPLRQVIYQTAVMDPARC
jgi:hypothetical protein